MGKETPIGVSFILLAMVRTKKTRTPTIAHAKFMLLFIEVNV